MKIVKLFLLLLLVFFLCPYPANVLAVSEKDADGWVTMPAGGKPAYMGIHGGTMPVSLLVSGDGSSLLSFVGITGNDFLEALREVFLPLPSFGNSTRHDATPPAATPTGIFAGNATASMPVVSLSGNPAANRALLPHLQYFGLSATPLRIEGEVARPQTIPVVRKYRNFFLRDYFQPRRK